MYESIKILKTLNYIPPDIMCAQDYELLAPDFIAPDRFAYIAGGSGHDATLRHNRTSFSDLSVVPRVLRNVEQGSTTTDLLGQQLQHPILLAPVAYQTLVHPDGEIATAYAARSTDSCMVASTLSSKTLEDIAEHAGPERWFQLYFQPDFNDTKSLLNRAVAAGYRAIVVTLDAAVQQPSRRALSANFSFPDDVQAANLMAQGPSTADPINPRHIFKRYMQNVPTREQLAWLIEQSPVPVLIKGVLHQDDALELKALGAAGVIVSNHGGRTLDGVPASLAMLPSIRAAVGDDFPLLLDSGIRSGGDIFKAIALGADAVLIGRLQVYALSVAGALGVAHMLKLLREELELTMAVAGCSSLDDIKTADMNRVLLTPKQETRSC